MKSMNLRQTAGERNRRRGGGQLFEFTLRFDGGALRDLGRPGSDCQSVAATPPRKTKKTVAELHLTYLNGRPSIGSANTANKKNKYSTSRPRTEI